MKTIAGALFFFSLSVSFLNPQTLFAQSSGYSRDVLDKINKVEQSLAGQLVVEGDSLLNLRQRMEYYRVPAVSIAVIKDFKIDWARAYGYADIKEKRPASPSTQFQAASISKSLNAMAMLKLVQDKKIDLYGDINNYLSSWKFPYDSLAGNKKISLANLLSHTAGLSVHGFRGYEPGDKIPAVVEILDGKAPANSAPVRLTAEPGVRSVYSGGGITISQLMAMDITKKPYQDFAKEAVLKPLGMKHSFFNDPVSEGTSDFATGYRATGDQLARKYHVYPEMAAAALWTTPTDIARFIIETQLSLQGKSNKVLSKDMTRLMLTPYIDRQAALGVFIEKKGGMTYFVHGGANEGFRSMYYGSTEGGNGVVVMVNSDNGSIMQEIINSVSTVYGWPDFYKPVIKKLAKVPDSVSSAYLGKYEVRPQFIVTITRENGQLMGEAPGQGKLELYPESENKYFVKSADIQLEFIKNESGVVDRMIVHQNGGKMPAKKL